jgi:hypothetical protein
MTPPFRLKFPVAGAVQAGLEQELIKLSKAQVISLCVCVCVCVCVHGSIAFASELRRVKK